jgi:hypothetical protein
LICREFELGEVGLLDCNLLGTSPDAEQIPFWTARNNRSGAFQCSHPATSGTDGVYTYVRLEFLVDGADSDGLLFQPTKKTDSAWLKLQEIVAEKNGIHLGPIDFYNQIIFKDDEEGLSEFYAFEAVGALVRETRNEISPFWAGCAESCGFRIIIAKSEFKFHGSVFGKAYRQAKLIQNDENFRSGEVWVCGSALSAHQNIFDLEKVNLLNPDPEIVETVFRVV